MTALPTGSSGDASMEELPVAECWDLLAGHEVGRFAVAVSGGAPHIVPVNYRVSHGDVYFRTGHGTKLLLLPAAPVSFEVDEVDRATRSGWSVLVQGHAYEATSWETDRLSIEPWAGGDRSHWIRVVPRQVTGRRIHLPAP